MRGVNTVRKPNGAVYYYHRATGKRLEGEPGSPAFLASYAAAEHTRLVPANDTLGVLIDQFRESPAWRGYSPKTKREWAYVLAAIAAEYGTVPLPALEDRAFRADAIAWRDRHAKTAPRAADTRLSVLSHVLAWAVDRGALRVNVLANTRRIYRSDRSESIWLPAHIEAFMAAAPLELQRCLMLALHTGQRQGDLIRLAWSAYDGRAIALRQGKTGARVVVPCTRPLKAMLDAMPRQAAVILTTSSGIAWSAINLQHRWLEAMRAAGIEGLRFHDLRGTAVTMLAEAGCTHQEIAGVTGHSLKAVAGIIDKYLARTRELAENAICKLDCKLSADAAKKASIPMS